MSYDFEIFHVARYISLPTAQIKIVNGWSYEVVARALLNQGSEASFVSKSLVQRISLMRRFVYVPIMGIGSSKISTAKSAVTIRFGTLLNNGFSSDLEALVLTHPASRLPSKRLPDSLIKLYKDVSLADSSFYKPSAIDLVLGVEVYAKVLKEGLNTSGSEMGFIVQNTQLGWIISGASTEKIARRVDSRPRLPRLAVHGAFMDELFTLVKRFWEFEEVPSHSCLLSPEEEHCEKHFAETHQRLKTGRYMVRIPLRMV